MKLGTVLKGYRYMNELTLRELSDEIGIPKSTLHDIEQGISTSGDNVAKIFIWLLQKDCYNTARCRDSLKAARTTWTEQNPGLG